MAGAGRGFTLLELLLALSLTVVVLLIIATGVTVQFRAFNNGRAQVERAQLARVLLHRMADDLRGALPPGQAADGDSSTQPTSSGGNSGLSFEGFLGLSADSSGSIAAMQSASSDGAATATDTTLAGVYGETDWLRIDVARAVKSETAASDGTASVDSATQSLRQIETIVYYVVAPDEAAVGALVDESRQSAGGLIRRELARPPAVWAARYASLDYLDASLAPLASEVSAVEFRYHDGSDWLETWDSAAAGKLPKAIEIRLFLVSESGERASSVRSTTGASAAADDAPDVQYRLIVPMPFEGPVETGGSGSSQASSAGSSSSPGESTPADSDGEPNPSGDAR